MSRVVTRNQLATLATLATFLPANRKLATKASCKPLQFNDVTSCQLQPFYFNRHIRGLLGHIIMYVEIVEASGGDARRDSRDDCSTRFCTASASLSKADLGRGFLTGVLHLTACGADAYVRLQ